MVGGRPRSFSNPNIIYILIRIDLDSISNLVRIYSDSIKNIPGISAYYNGKFNINATASVTLDKIRIAYEVKSDYENIDENPQLLADYLEDVLGVDVELYNVDAAHHL